MLFGAESSVLNLQLSKQVMVQHLSPEVAAQQQQFIQGVCDTLASSFLTLKPSYRGRDWLTRSDSLTVSGCTSSAAVRSSFVSLTDCRA